ncbi:uncharacterized protein LOC111408306 [Olea europaea var. sylvestris]|uniref:uncharacterized protein LOC111408306 n=1 Tax=Olea europaea var. sylvestris TaxID=158386 RepID=UPI000C1CEB00|nr:uncharacterized protein LOC111408306 [Olea europaea var. sylvestris]
MDILVVTINREMYGMESLLMTMGKMTLKIMFAIVSKLLFLYADIVLQILEADRYLVIKTPKPKKGSALHALARKPLSHYGTIQEWLCERLARIVPSVPFNMNFRNNLAKICRFQKDIWFNNFKEKKSQSVGREEEVFNLIYYTGAIKDLLMVRKDKFGNNVLQLAAKLPPSSRLNSEVENILRSPPQSSNVREGKLFHEAVAPLDGVTVLSLCATSSGGPPYTLEEHEELREASERWMKDTSTFYMVVANLTATVALNASFIVPNGNKVAHNRRFTVFATSNALAMFSSTASIMTFLSILTSGYGEDDFLYILTVMVFCIPLNNPTVKVYVPTRIALQYQGQDGASCTHYPKPLAGVWLVLSYSTPLATARIFWD